MVFDCKLLVVLWSGNDNERCQLQVPICSVIHHCSFVLYKDTVADMWFPNSWRIWRIWRKFYIEILIETDLRQDISILNELKT
jgi:hypothetical protein